MSCDLISGLAQVLTEWPQFRQLVTGLQSGREEQSISVLDAAKPILLGALWLELRVPMLVVTARPEDARRLYDQFLAYWGYDAPIHHFAELETLPFERLMADAATTHQRLQALAALAGTYPEEQSPLIVTSASGVALKTLGLESFQINNGYQVLRRGDVVSMEPLLKHWSSIGYRMESATEVPGTMSRRGGIVDVFPVGNPLPVRLEFWGDTLESLRTFDPISQRSMEPVNLVVLIPARELLPALADREHVEQAIRHLDTAGCAPEIWSRMEEELSLLVAGQYVEDATFYTGIFNNNSILDFLPTQGVLVMDQPTEVEEAFQEQDRRSFELRDVKRGRGELPAGFPSPYFLWETLARDLNGPHLRLNVARWSGKQSTSFPFVQAPSFWGQIDQFMTEISDLTGQGQRVIIVTNHAQRLRELMTERDLESRLTHKLDNLPPPGSVTLVHGSISNGWLAPLGRSTALFTDMEVFGTTKVSRPRRKHPIPRETFLSEVTPGSYVVHIDHGVALFAGTISLGKSEEEREYLVLEYGDGDKLYVPTEQSDRVGPYVAPGDKAPALTRLGTHEWARTKDRVRHSTREMAEELLALYAQREVTTGIAFEEDSPWQREMEDAFPYVETPDQLAAVSQVKEDMESSRPMDRLVCGDVGYGKTEIALRAAFKGVTHGMQVAVLVPTTVLAQQHYATFSERLGPYPVTVDVLSRFRTDHEQRSVLEGLAEGTVDICIGTHRLLQKDVRFKNLGLVIVDEEHRFGVAHKERFKRMRTQIDVLTLSATPIPRTLNMVLSGIRDLSTMETPPEERRPIKTYVSEESSDLVREAILRELDRGGQVYFVHNRIYNINHIADSLRTLVPEATIAIGHGRMPKALLEKVMTDFSKGEFDVLLCTTIIESGLDLPNVNTLIVDRADTFGLAQLYQLRGRVGRSSNRAYAYFLVPRGRRITETAQKRLETILAATELGAGFRIAMKDLEIRGAGRVLGAEQSGQIHAVGFDLYSKLLSQAVEELKTGKGISDSPEEERTEITIDLHLPAHIPREYVEDLPTRLNLYQRLSRVRSIEDIRQIQEELRDRFGQIPRQTHSLLYTVRVRVLAEAAGVEAVTMQARSVAIRLKEDVGGAGPALEKTLGPNVRIGNRLLHLKLEGLGRPWGLALLELLESVKAFKERIASTIG